MSIINKIINKYDIRGIWGEDLNEDSIYIIIEGIAEEIIFNYKDTLNSIAICIGEDSRESSQYIRDLLINFFIKKSINVIILDIVSTPMLYFNMYDAEYINQKSKMNLVFGIMITASHNSNEYNGMKIMRGEKCLNGDDIHNIISCKKIYEQYNTSYYNNKLTEGNVLNFNINERYLDVVFNKFKNINDYKYALKILWNLSNGVMTSTINSVISRLSHNTHVVINLPPEDFINSAEVVLHEKCNIGFIFDTDGDRITIILSNGRILKGDELIFVFAFCISRCIKSRAKDIAKDSADNFKMKIMIDIKCGDVIIKALKNSSIDSVFTPSGHSLIKKQLQTRDDISFAGEISGHIYFNSSEYYPFDDALYAALKIIWLYNNSKDIFLEAISLLPKERFYKKFKINYNNVEFKKLINNIKIKLNKIQKQTQVEAYQQTYPKINFKLQLIDGLRCSCEYGFFLIRKSNTENYTMIIVEGNTPDGLLYLLNILNDCKLKLKDKNIHL